MSGASARLSRLHTPVETSTPPYRGRKLKIKNASLVCALSLKKIGVPSMGNKFGIAMEIVTHPTVGMCYNSMKFHQVFVNLTISFTGVTLASTR